MHHETFMRLALQQAKQALANNEFPVGAVIVSDSEPVAAGRRENSQSDRANELDHAEIVALRDLLARRPDIDRQSLTVYSTMEPCLMCYSTMLLNGIRTFVYAYEDAMGGGTGLQLTHLAPLYQAMMPEVHILPHVLRQESLTLFKTFFSSPANNYWHESLLAEYTLAQP
ncbi:nucleoside deaminase [Thiovibrio frasassiensis]|uniref:Nucleoside deaminase n=1 Tax=Thiovibrio frasassiensis TaxID=2984131 RepID=A0A9X4MEI7_9BACT|nr:nucleoside deaminase [Thiovibrio frasassiensis]MDG4474820.1 nucleoside deaminase [Thiovibrio frasassiensis]